MAAFVEQVFKAALDLQPVERAELIEKLFQSFDRSSSKRTDSAWAEEVESRFDAFDRAELKESPVEDVFARLNQR